MNMKQHYYSSLAIQAWEQRHPPQQRNTPISPPSCTAIWEALQQKVAQCNACPLSKTRTQTVFGVGNHKAKLMVIGEAPGYHEDQQGEPFVGRAGQLLTAMMKSINLARQDIYIANILKCRPPHNRDPEPIEVQTCTPFLDQQIALIEPLLLLAVGRIAAHYLLHTRVSLMSLRGKIHHYGVHHIPLIITYHPAYLLRNPADKKKAFLDLQFTRQTLTQALSTQKSIG